MLNRKSLAFLLAATLLAGTVHSARAGEAAPEDDQPEISRENEWRGRGPGRGRNDGPGPDRRFGRHHDDGWHRGGRPERGPGGPGPGFRCGTPRMHGKGGDMGMGLGRGWEALDLDDTQKSKLIDVMTENYRARLETRMEMLAARKNLRKLQDAETLDADAVIAANANLGMAKGKLEVLRRQLRDNVRGVLNADQLKKLDEWKDNRPGRGGPRDGDDRPEGKRGPGPRPQGGPGPRK